MGERTCESDTKTRDEEGERVCVHLREREKKEEATQEDAQVSMRLFLGYFVRVRDDGGSGSSTVRGGG